MLLESAVRNLMVVVLGEGGEAVSAVIRAARFLGALGVEDPVGRGERGFLSDAVGVGVEAARAEVQSMVAGNADP